MAPLPGWARQGTARLDMLARLGRRMSRTGMLLWEARRGGDAMVGPELAERVSWFAENLCAAHGLDVEIRGRVPSSPAVLVANHVGWLDPLVVLGVAPAIPIAKHELVHWPVVGPALDALGCIGVWRGDPYSGALALRRALRVLAVGASVLVFPEGTTSDLGSILPLRRGIFGVAARARVPVVPVALRYEDHAAAWVGDAWFVPNYARMLVRDRMRVRVTFGEAIRPAASAEATARLARAQLAALLENRPKIVALAGAA